jgi:hypothetical protein
MTHRYREQARSHKDLWWGHKLQLHRRPLVGAELARDDGSLFNINVS